MKRLLLHAGLDSDHALVRWGNYDWTLLLPATVFAPDDTGRSYRLRPRLRSVWLRGVKLAPSAMGFFLVPDTPELAQLIEGTGASIQPHSVQTTNSWGLRGPEPDLTAPLRGLVLGDSNAQGMLLGDDETPVAYLARELERNLETRVALLNTGLIGYSPEQHYFTLLEYGGPLPAPLRAPDPLHERFRRNDPDRGRPGGGALLDRQDRGLLPSSTASPVTLRRFPTRPRSPARAKRRACRASSPSRAGSVA